MARYRKIETRIWNDHKFNNLSDDGKLVFFFLLTHPHQTAIGAMRATIPGLASELGWKIERFQKALAEGYLKSMLRYDEKASFIWLPNFLKYNQPESPNVVKSWEHALDYLPECSLKNVLILQVKTFISSLSSTFQEALPEAFNKAMANQEPEQEPKQEQEPKNQSMSDKPDDITLDDFFKNAQPSKTANAELKVQAIEVLQFLNEKTGRAYRPVDINLKLITARLKSGATVASCFQVIAKKTREWKSDPKMSEYLRPATLFNATKFEQYVGELVTPTEATAV